MKQLFKKLFSFKLSFKTNLIALAILIIMANLAGGLFLYNKVAIKDNLAKIVSGVKSNKSDIGRVAGESVSQSNSLIPANIKSIENTKSPTPSPTASPISTTSPNQIQSTAPTTNNYVIYHYPSPTPYLTNKIYIPSPTNTPAPSGPDKWYCDNMYKSATDLAIYLINNSKNNYEAEKNAWLNELAKRGYGPDSQTVKDYLITVDAKYAPELDKIESDYNNKINALKAEGCQF